VAQGNGLPRWFLKTSLVLLMTVVGPVLARAQAADPPPDTPKHTMDDAIGDLQQQVRELREAVAEVRAEAAQYRAETKALRRELEAARGQISAAQPSAPTSAYQTEPAATESTAPMVISTSAKLEDRVTALEDSSRLLSSKVDDQDQTKVESASKYKVRLSGIVLMNLFSNRGSTENQDFPTWAIPSSSPSSPNGNFGATVRQSQIGLEVFGPRLAGARTTGNLQFDFAGGFPGTVDGVNFGLMRMRIGTVRMDWEHTSIVAGQDAIFFSPLTPTSYASLAVPAFSYAGNLWGWTPQVRVEHRFTLAGDQSILLQGGILDNLTGETPPYPVRVPQAGERSGHPAYATRVAWTRQLYGQPLTLGAAGYYSRQDWGLERYGDGWAGAADLQVPLAPRVTLTGEFYRGRGIGGLGGGIGRSIVYNGDPSNPFTQIRALNAIGGWSQLKLRAHPKLEFNGAVGVDNPYAADLRGFTVGQSYIDPSLSQNRSALVNFIYKPRSNLLFSSEFRHLKTYTVQGSNQTAEQINMMMGILF
jgi:hypothetical protein